MKTIRILFAVTLMLPVLAFAESKVGIVDPLQAIQNATEVQKSTEQLKTDLKSETGRLKKLHDEISDIEKKMQKESMTLSQQQKEDLSDKHQAKVSEYRSLQQVVQKRIRKDRDALMKRMQPKVMQAVQDIAKEKHLDVVINAEAVLYAHPDMDITNEVTKELNTKLSGDKNGNHKK